MKPTNDGAAACGTNRFDMVEALLTRYPDIDAKELDTLTRWFSKEASSFEVASMASKESVASGYRQFRAEHIDRFTASDVVRAVAFAAIMIAVVTAVILPGL